MSDSLTDREAAIETMARAMFDASGDEPLTFDGAGDERREWIDMATAALRALLEGQYVLLRDQLEEVLVYTAYLGEMKVHGVPRAEPLFRLLPAETQEPRDGNG